MAMARASACRRVIYRCPLSVLRAPPLESARYFGVTSLPKFQGGVIPESAPSSVEAVSAVPGKFDASRHLSGLVLNKEPVRTMGFESLGFDPKREPRGGGGRFDERVGDYAACEPFPLLSAEGLRQMRRELEADPVLRNCTKTSEVAPLVMRDTTRFSPFIAGLWASEEVAGYLSALARVQLSPHPMRQERGHVNIQHADVRDRPVFKWHYDSQPFVCIVSISDVPASGNIGTLFKDGRGDVQSVKPPAAGYAVLLQGHVLEHCAPASPFERMTMVTSYVPSETQYFDSDRTDLRFSSQYSDNTLLYPEFFEYRLGCLERRCADLRSATQAGGLKDYHAMCKELDRLAGYLSCSRSALAGSEDK